MLEGQWIFSTADGRYGTIDIEHVRSRYEGTLSLWTKTRDQGLLIEFATKSDAIPSETAFVNINASDFSGRLLRHDEIQFRRGYNEFIPRSGSLKFSTEDERLIIDWSTESGSGVIVACKSLNLEMKPSNIKSWVQFKSYVGRQPAKRFIYRGHESNTWRLTTSFHREKRYNLLRYVLQDIQELQRIFSSLTGKILDVDQQPLHYASFLNLAQHHGYPTPLLDWTRSPYVAAFFAYRRLDPNTDYENKKIRIYKFDLEKWNKLPRYNRFYPCPLHLSILDPAALDNLRAIPQQAISCLTNIVDIDSYIVGKEEIDRTSYMEAVDLPARYRNHVMKELALMGITAGSLFPGLDGACESLKEANFGPHKGL